MLEPQYIDDHGPYYLRFWCRRCTCFTIPVALSLLECDQPEQSLPRTWRCVVCGHICQWSSDLDGRFLDQWDDLSRRDNGFMALDECPLRQPWHDERPEVIDHEALRHGRYGDWRDVVRRVRSPF